MTRSPSADVKWWRNKLAESKATMREIDEELDHMDAFMVGKYWTHKRRERKAWLHEIRDIFEPQIICEERKLAYLIKEESYPT